VSAYIPKDFEPNEKTYKALKADGIVQAFLDQYVTQHFTEFWNELKDDKKKKGLKSAWQTCYRIWARRAFHGKLGREYEDNLHKRTFGHGRSKPNIFQEVQADLMKSTSRPLQPPLNTCSTPVQHPLKAGKPMSRKKALAELGKLSKKLGGRK